MLVCQVDGLVFLEPRRFKNLECIYFLGQGDKYIVIVSKGEQEYTSIVYKIAKREFVEVTTFTTNFIKSGSRFVEINGSSDEFFVHVKLNCVVRYRLEGGKHVEVKKIKHNAQIHGLHVTDTVVMAVSNNISVEDRNFSSATVYDLNGILLHNRDFRNVQEAKIIHNHDGELTRLHFDGLSASVRR